LYNGDWLSSASPSELFANFIVVKKIPCTPFFRRQQQLRYSQFETTCSNPEAFSPMAIFTVIGVFSERLQKHGLEARDHLNHQLEETIMEDRCERV
jgi:hypothetical protein